MKKGLSQLGAAALFGAMVSTAPVALAQVAVSETTTTQSAGTVSEFSPDTVVLKSETSAEPIRYSYSKTTTVVDESGNPVDVSIIKTGVPVQVYYAKEGDGMVARKIIVRKRVGSASTGVSSSTSGGVIEKHDSTTTTTETH